MTRRVTLKPGRPAVMILRTYRYGDAGGLDGLSVGVARHPPRGVRRDDYVAKGFFDTWLPLLAPSADLVKRYLHEEITRAVFFRSYRKEMQQPGPRHVIELLAATALRMPVNLGCFCEDETNCHRSVLRVLVLEAVEKLPPAKTEPRTYASPPCSMPEIEDDL